MKRSDLVTQNLGRKNVDPVLFYDQPAQLLSAQRLALIVELDKPPAI